jgi:hypothetical protein
MSEHTYNQGREDAAKGEHNPPGDSLGETLSSETHRFYEHKRDDYERGQDDWKNENEK